MNREDLRRRARRRMDAATSSRWDVTAGAAGELDQIGGIVHWREWRRLLNANRFLRFKKRTPTSDANGRYLITDLNSGTGDALETLYRIVSFQVDDIPYQETPFEEWSVGEQLGLANRVWWREGDLLFALPKQASKAADIWVNHIPQRLDLLTADSIEVTFPAGYEEILALEWAALALAKGGAETQVTREFKGLAEELRQDMLQDLARTSTAPWQMRHSDYPMDWASQ